MGKDQKIVGICIIAYPANSYNSRFCEIFMQGELWRYMGKPFVARIAKAPTLARFYFPFAAK